MNECGSPTNAYDYHVRVLYIDVLKTLFAFWFSWFLFPLLLFHGCRSESAGGAE